MNRKQIVRKLKATNKITFMCMFCFSHLQITKNHFCDEALEVDGAIHPRMKEILRKDFLKKQKQGLL
tara:strand:+ start:263 stop:463 length:201 start_codon:yes stop_codon:yes gene_type:complete